MPETVDNPITIKNANLELEYMWFNLILHNREAAKEEK